MEPISIIIISLNEEKRIGRLLTDLSAQTYRNFEVIVVDSNSDDNTCNIANSFAEQLPAMTVHKMGERGVSLGRNTGVKIAKHERVLFLDADVRLHEEFLAKSITKLTLSKIDVAGVYMGSKDLPMAQKMGYFTMNLGLFATQFFFPTAVGACIFSTQSVHHQLQGFATDIILCEDCDYVKRAAKIARFKFLSMTFEFDPRRLEQEGLFTMGATYCKANLRRMFKGEMRNNEMQYQFGHYHDQSSQHASSL